MNQNNFRQRLFSGIGGDPSLPSRVTVLENNEYEVVYFTEINGTTGTITPPTGATILLDQFQSGADAFVSTITGNQPTGTMPQTSGGSNVDVTSFDALGNFTLSGTPSSYPVALIYTFKISGLNWSNINLNNVINYYLTNLVRSNDSRLIDSRDQKAYGLHTQSLCASTGSDEILYAITLPAMSTGTIWEFIMQLRCTSSANNKTYKAWMNTTADLTGSPVQIAQLTATTNSAAITFQRRYAIRSSTSILSAYAATTSASNPYASSTVLPAEITSLPSMSSATYLVVSCNRANAGDVAGAEWINVKISR